MPAPKSAYRTALELMGDAGKAVGARREARFEAAREQTPAMEPVLQ